MHFANPSHNQSPIQRSHTHYHHAADASLKASPQRPPKLYPTVSSETPTLFVRVHPPHAQPPAAVTPDERPTRAASKDRSVALSPDSSPQLRFARSPMTPSTANSLPPSQNVVRALESSEPAQETPPGRSRQSVGVDSAVMAVELSESKPLRRKVLAPPAASSPPPLQQPQTSNLPAISSGNTLLNNHQALNDQVRAFLAHHAANSHVTPGAPVATRGPLQNSPHHHSRPSDSSPHHQHLEDHLRHQVQAAERHGREAILERQLATYQELRMEFVMTRHSVAHQRHAKEERQRKVLDVEPARHILSPSKASDVETYATPHRGAPPATGVRYSATKNLMLRYSPRNVGGSTAFDTICTVLIEEERSSRCLLEASYTNLQVFTRQLWQCYVQGLHPYTIIVQERHGFGLIRAAFEAENAVVMDTFIRWQWEQHAARVQFWAKRMTSTVADEDRGRDATQSEQWERRSALVQQFHFHLQLLHDDFKEEQNRMSAQRRRAYASLTALEASARASITDAQATKRRQLRLDEEASFSNAVLAVSLRQSCTSLEFAAREDLEASESCERRALFASVSNLLQSSMSVAHDAAAPEAQRRAALRQPTLSHAHATFESVTASTSAEEVPLGEETYHSEELDGTQPPKRVRIVNSQSPSRVHRPSPLRLSSTPSSFMAPTTSSQSKFNKRVSTPPSTRGGSDVGTLDFSVTDHPATGSWPLRSMSQSSSAAHSNDGESFVQLGKPTLVVSPTQLQRNINRLSQPKRRAVDITTDSDAVFTTLLTSLASVNSIHSRDDISATPPLPSPDSFSYLQTTQSSYLKHQVTKSRNPGAEPMGRVSPHTRIAQGNSVMILRGNAPPSRHASPGLAKSNSGAHKTSPQRAKPVPKRAAVSEPKESRSERRYVDALYLKHGAFSSKTQVTGPVANGQQQLGTDGRPPTGKESSPAVHNSVGEGHGKKPALTKWEEATLKMYENRRVAR